MTLHILTAVLQGLTALLLLGAGGYGFALQRRVRRDRRRASSVEGLDAALQRWRIERRLLRAGALQAWQADFDALLPPAPPCTSSEHNHVENYRIGSAGVEVICVVRPPMARGGMVLAPGEHVLNAREVARQLGLGGITVQEAVAAMARIAEPQRAVRETDRF